MDFKLVDYSDAEDAIILVNQETVGRDGLSFQSAKNYVLQRRYNKYKDVYIKMLTKEEYKCEQWNIFTLY